MSEQKAFYAGISIVIGFSLLILFWLAAKQQFRAQLDTALTNIVITQPRPDDSSPATASAESVLGENDEFQTSPTTATPNIAPEQLYLLINAHRKNNGLTPLNVHPALMRSAQAKLNDMIANGYFRHEDVANLESWYLFKESGYHFARAGENLSFNYNTPWQIFDAWVNSPAHNQQLLESEYEDMGLASDCATFAQHSDGGCLVVLHLGTQ